MSCTPGGRGGRGGNSTKQEQTESMSAYKLVSVDHAIRTALEECSSLASSGKVERVLTAEVNTILGRVVASDVVSTVAIPNYDASIKDGFAVKCRTEVDADDNVPVKLEVVGSSRAGVEGYDMK